MSLNGKYDPGNIFAQILRGDMPCVKVYEDDNTLGFMDVFPQSRGHMLVVHKHEHARNLTDVSPEGLVHIMASVQKLTRAATKTLGLDGVIVTQFNGAPAGQTVFHLHVHIVPHYAQARIGAHAQGEMANIDDLTALAAKISAAL
jgi:histidine triad (HIT) family protein